MIGLHFLHSLRDKMRAAIFSARLLSWLKKGMKGGIWLFIGMLLIDVGTSYLVRERVYTELHELPYRDNAVVLGTAKFYTSGSPNLYYKYRLEAAQSLFESKKVGALLMSGDNKTPYYNEPKMMSRDLNKMGVPMLKIRQDYAGYSTLDSVIRADKVYHLAPFTIVSQQFHCERALLIAKFKGIDAICYAAKYPDAHYKVRIREFFARTAMVISLLLGIEPDTLEERAILEPPKAATSG